jgi:hypothetical protein
MQFSELGSEQALAFIGISTLQNQGIDWATDDAIALDESALWSNVVRNTLQQIRGCSSKDEQYFDLLSLAARLFTAGRLAGTTRWPGEKDGSAPLAVAWAVLLGEQEVSNICDDDAVALDESPICAEFLRQSLDSILSGTDDLEMISFSGRCFSAGRYAGWSMTENPSRILRYVQ